MAKLKDGTTKPFEKGDKVLYIPIYLLVGNKNEMVKENNLGVVTSKNDTYVFVKFKENLHSQAVKPDDLYFLEYRKDLQNLIDE